MLAALVGNPSKACGLLVGQISNRFGKASWQASFVALDRLAFTPRARRSDGLVPFLDLAWQMMACLRTTQTALRGPSLRGPSLRGLSLRELRADL